MDRRENCHRKAPICIFTSNKNRFRPVRFISRAFIPSRPSSITLTLDLCYLYVCLTRYLSLERSKPRHFSRPPPLLIFFPQHFSIFHLFSLNSRPSPHLDLRNRPFPPSLTSIYHIVISWIIFKELSAKNIPNYYFRRNVKKLSSLQFP